VTAEPADTVGNAALAADRLDRSSNSGFTDESRTFNALQGIGYALLAIADRLATTNEAGADVAAHLEQLCISTDELTAARPHRIRRLRRAWRRQDKDVAAPAERDGAGVIA
jgi:hypothetical protein